MTDTRVDRRELQYATVQGELGSELLKQHGLCAQRVRRDVEIDVERAQRLERQWVAREDFLYALPCVGWGCFRLAFGRRRRRSGFRFSGTHERRQIERAEVQLALQHRLRSLLRGVGERQCPGQLIVTDAHAQCVGLVARSTERQLGLNRQGF
ncbi:MAG: hypothetical protein P8106_08495, partial [Gammaproteobacteria bacterium]